MDTTRLKQLVSLCGIALVLAPFGLGAAAPRVFTPWAAFKGTNGIVIVTNRTTEQVRVDGAALQNQNSATSNALNGAFIRNFNGTGTNLMLYSSNTTSIALTTTGIIGGTNMVEFMGTNSTTSIGPSGGVHIGGLSAIGGSNLVVEGRVGIATNSPQAPFHLRAALTMGGLRLDDTNGTARIQTGVYPGLPQYGAIWLGDVAKTALNLGIYGSMSEVSYGSPGNLYFNRGSVASHTTFFTGGGTTMWTIGPNGHILAGTDNTYNIGASGASRPKQYHGAGAITNAAVIHGAVGFSSGASNLLQAATITVGASPFNWTNTSGVNVVSYVDGISVTGTVGINGGVIFNSIGQDTVLLGPNEWMTITYTIGSPTATWRPR